MNISVTNTTDKPAQNLDLEKDIVLSVKGVSKKFCRDLKRSLLYGVQDIAGEVLGKSHENQELRPKEFWALQDVSFELRRGEALGLVGKNGSGKSTLLRIIAGLIKPDKGTVEVNGRVAPLIALGAGFNPILTGRENIYANMSILGLSKQEIDERFDDVVEFAEIGEAIDSPVQSYSSGMAARLGFASAIFTEPDILLVDEVLAVGDVKFRIKCYRRISKLQKLGTTIILVSHNQNSILGLCNSAIYINSGKSILFGKTDLIMKKYESDLFLNSLNKEKENGILNLQNREGKFSINSIYFKDPSGEIIQSPLTGKPISLCVDYQSPKKVNSLIFNLLIKERYGEGESVLNVSNYTDKISLSAMPGARTIKFMMPYCCLRPGLYVAKLSISEESIYNILDAVETFCFIVESSESMSQCLFYQPHSWKVL